MGEDGGVDGGANDDDGTGDRQDGRTARRDRNRTAVLDVVLDMFREGVAEPDPDAVAVRSGLSRRSVQRYFEDSDALVRAAMARHMETVMPLFAVEGTGEGALADRVDRLVAARLELFEAVAPMARVALVRAATNPLIAERLRERRRWLHDQVAAMFAPELAGLPGGDRDEVTDAVDLLTGFEAMDHLREHRGLSRDAAHRVLARAVGAVVRDAAAR
jgi:TetR/AcrR family transcriptional regulator of autoinduction and epiphytic fitness